MPNVRFAPGAEGSQSFVSEGAGWFTITMLLSQPSAVPVTIVVRPFASGVDGADMDLGGAQGSQSFASEGAGSFTITLTLSHASSVPVSVTVRPFPGAVTGADMDMSDHVVTFAPGLSRAQI